MVVSLILNSLILDCDVTSHCLRLFQPVWHVQEKQTGPKRNPGRNHALHRVWTFDIDVKEITVRLKVPYLTLLKELIESCECF